jgi:diacylglycerol kinase family enzyme
VAPRVLLIWNPVSTGVDAEAVGAVSVTIAEQTQLVAINTRESGDAGRLAKQATAEGYDAVFVLGGDGTANEVVNGLGNALPIGVLPAGGTSVLPRVLGLPSGIQDCATRLCVALGEGSTRSVSLGTLNGRRFTFAAGVGLDAEIVQRIDERGRGGEGVEAKRPGDIWFVREAIDLLLSGDYAEPRVRVHLPGQPQPLPAATMFIANCDPWSFAGPLPLRVAPDASFEDGLDLVLIESVQGRSAPRRIGSLLRRKRGATQDDESDGVRRVRNIESARIECDEAIPVQVDGEFVGELETIELGLIRDGAIFLV